MSGRGTGAAGAAFWSARELASQPELSAEAARARGPARPPRGSRRCGLGRDRSVRRFLRGRRDGRFELRDRRWRGRRFVADDKRRRHLRGPVMVVGRDDADGGAGRLLRDAFDRAFAAAEIAEGQAFRQSARSQPQPLAARVGEGRQFRSISGPDRGGRQVDIRLCDLRRRRVSQRFGCHRAWRLGRRVPPPTGARSARSRFVRADSIPPRAAMACLSPPAIPAKERAGAIAAMPAAVISSSGRSSPASAGPADGAGAENVPAHRARSSRKT